MHHIPFRNPAEEIEFLESQLETCRKERDEVLESLIIRPSEKDSIRKNIKLTAELGKLKGAAKSADHLLTALNELPPDLRRKYRETGLHETLQDIGSKE